MARLDRLSHVGHDSTAKRWTGLILGLGLVAALALLDAFWRPGGVMSSTVVIGPFLTALLAPPRHTAVVAVAALAAAVAGGSWNDNFGSEAWILRVVVVLVGAGFAVFASRARRRAAESSQRFGLLAALAEIADGDLSLEETVRRITDLLVPALADFVVVDVVQETGVRRLGVRAHGPQASETEAWLQQRPPADPDVEVATRHAAETGQVQLIEVVTDEMLQRFARDEEDLQQLRSLDARSFLSVPLRTRGRILGAMLMAATAISGRRYDADDAEFAEVLSGRAALALDNAGLFAELQTMEARLSAAMGTLADAVTIQTPYGRLLYANDAAARSMGFASREELLATRPEDIIARYDSYHEDGTPVAVEELPGRRVLRGEQPEPLVLRAVNRATGEERWNVVKSTGVLDTSGQPVLAVNVIEDITEAKRAEFRQQLLARAGELLTSSLDYEQTLQQVADLTVPRLADWCGVSLPDRHGMLRQVAVAHIDPEKVRFAREVSVRYPTRVSDPSGSAQVLREGVSQWFNDIPDELLRASAQDDEHYELVRGLGMHSAMIVPLKVAGRTIGTLTLVSAESRHSFSRDDVEVAEELARRAGAAVENARLYSERSEIAETLQAGLLPQPLPSIPGWSTAALYRPAGHENSVGGDFYDGFTVAGGWMVVVGDVAGRGAPAAALTALTRYTLRATAQLLDDPLDAVDRLNKELHERADGALCTVACVLLGEGDNGNGLATVVCAGHPQPFAIRGGRAEQVGEFGPMVGALAAPVWSRVTVELEPGDTLVLYTDGVMDTTGEQDRFGEERLRETLTGAGGPAEAVARIDGALRAFQEGEQADDVAVVALSRARAPVPVAAGASGRTGSEA